MAATNRAGRADTYRHISLFLGAAAALSALCGVVLGYRLNTGSGPGLGALVAPPPAPPAQIVVNAAAQAIPTAAEGDPPIGGSARAGASGIDHGDTRGAGPLNPSVPVTVSVTHGLLREVSLINASNGLPVPATLAPDRHSWRSNAPLSYAQTYQLRVTAADSDQHSVQRTATLTTIAARQLIKATFVPGAASDTVGVGQPLVVRFNHRVADHTAAEHALAVTSNPSQPGAWYWMSDTEAHYRPAAYWAPGTTLTLAANLFGAALGNGAFGQANQGETVHIHDSWIARADGNTEHMAIYHNGQLVKTMAISLGSPTHPSHNGPHVISSKAPSVIMDSCTYGVCQGDPGYYRETVYLDERISSDGEFVHSAPWSVGQQGDRNVSHGCINLSPANAAWFYQHFNIGDVVEITHSGGPPLPVWDTYGDWELTWPQWQTHTKVN
jgi:lipoprotein-anchoring transpeptidase ErfK/SrfK